MKIFSVIFIFSTVVSIRAEPQKVTNDRERWNIRGPVKSIEDSWFELVQEGEKVVPGKPYRELEAEQVVFNQEGNVIERNSGDIRTKLEPVEGVTKVRSTTHDKEGKVNHTKIVVTEFDDLGYPGKVEMVNEDGKPVYVQTYIRKGNSLKIKSEMPGLPGPPMTITYIYDKKGRVAQRKFSSMAGKESRWEYEWKKFDKFGNGLEAHVRVDGEETPGMLHLVKFTYY